MLANTTIDQVVAKRIGQDTPLPSLELATEDFTGYVGGCSPGFSCAYMNTISWSSPTTPLPMETNPRAVFERHFRRGRHARANGAQRLAKKRSILDSISAEASELQRGLGPRDRARLGDYLDNVREIERRIQRAENHKSETDCPTLPSACRIVRRARGPDVRSGGRGLAGRCDARVHVHDVARTQPAHLSADRRHRAASHRFAPPEQCGEDGEMRQDQHLLRRSCTRGFWQS